MEIEGEEFIFDIRESETDSAKAEAKINRMKERAAKLQEFRRSMIISLEDGTENIQETIAQERKRVMEERKEARKQRKKEKQAQRTALAKKANAQ